MNASNEMSPHKRPIWKRRRLLILTGLGLVILLVGGGWLGVNWLASGQGKVAVPPRLAGLPLSSHITGQAALTEIQRLHGKDFSMIDGAVAYYGDGRAILWISSTRLPSMAARQVEAMTERIAAGRSPFTPLDTIEVKGMTIYVLTGMSQIHYYFQLDRRVVWLAVSPQYAEQSLQELIHSLQQIDYSKRQARSYLAWSISTGLGILQPRVQDNEQNLADP
jgi:hypothetical protein